MPEKKKPLLIQPLSEWLIPESRNDDYKGWTFRSGKKNVIGVSKGRRFTSEDIDKIATDFHKDDDVMVNMMSISEIRKIIQADLPKKMIA